MAHAYNKIYYKPISNTITTASETERLQTQDKQLLRPPPNFRTLRRTFIENQCFNQTTAIVADGWLSIFYSFITLHFICFLKRNQLRKWKFRLRLKATEPIFKALRSTAPNKFVVCVKYLRLRWLEVSWISEECPPQSNLHPVNQPNFKIIIAPDLFTDKQTDRKTGKYQRTGERAVISWWRNI